MGLMIEEIKEMRKMVKQLDAGKITPEQVTSKLKIYKEVHKRVKLMADIYIACNSPHLIESRLHGLNILSKGECVTPPEEIELEMIKCPDQDKAISREDCLSFSGEEKNFENCKSCEHFVITRKLLIK